MVGEVNCMLCLDGLRGNGHYTRNRFVGVGEIYKPGQQAGSSFLHDEVCYLIPAGTLSYIYISEQLLLIL